MLAIKSTLITTLTLILAISLLSNCGSGGSTEANVSEPSPSQQPWIDVQPIPLPIGSPYSLTDEIQPL